MRLSTKGRYALEALVMLGFMGGENLTVKLKSISSETGISMGYLEQLFRELKNSGIITSKKGKNGGYQMAKSLDKTTVGEIFRSVEGSLSPVKCIDDEYCKRYDYCISINLWKKLYDEINNVVDNITLANLLAKYKNKIKSG